MTDRRFEDKPDLAPWSVRGLAEDHPAMVEGRTLFPSTVVTVTEAEPGRLLVSGENNRKLGSTVAKGNFKDYALYGLSLEERATCPTDCAVRDICYGNGMQMARRHRIGDPEVFYDRLAFEICELLTQHPDGLLIRLHVLGDFPDVEYVGFWMDALEEHEKLAIYGYTSRRTTAWGGDEIGDAIEALKDRYPGRARIRWSGNISRPDGAMVIDFVPKQPRIPDGIVCPAQTDATACCASCGLCWEPNAAKENIVFIRHGPKSQTVSDERTLKEHAEAAPEMSGEMSQEMSGVRKVAPMRFLPAVKPAPLTAKTPEVMLVAPHELLIEESYQRDLSPRSVSLMRKIVSQWDWSKFKPPVCARTRGGLFVIDGQHTAIAAASHPEVTQIPVLVVEADRLEDRAMAFVSHNRDRLAMSALQIFHADLAARDKIAVLVKDAAAATGAIIPRSPPQKGKAKAGEVVAIGEIRAICSSAGSEVLQRIFRIAVAAEIAPLNRMVIRALRMLLTAEYFADFAKMPDSRLANALMAVGMTEELDRMARDAAAVSGDSPERALASMISGATDLPEVVEAA